MSKNQSRLHWQALAVEALIRSGVEIEEASGVVGWNGDDTKARSTARRWAYNRAGKLAIDYDLQDLCLNL